MFCFSSKVNDLRAFIPTAIVSTYVQIRCDVRNQNHKVHVKSHTELIMKTLFYFLRIIQKHKYDHQSVHFSFKHQKVILIEVYENKEY